MTEEKLRVLMIAPTPFFADRGCHVRIFEEARSLIRMGHDVRIATYHLGRDMPGIPTWRIPAIPWYGKLAAGPSWHKPYLDMLLFLKAYAAAREFKPQILHAHLHEGAFVGVFLKRIFKVPLVFDFQGSLTTEIVDHGFVTGGSIPCRIFRALERFINGAADFIVTSSGSGRRELVERWGVGDEKVRSLMDGVNCDEFRPFPKEEARKALNLPAGRLVAVFLGVLNPYQGLDILLDVMGLIKESGVPIHFLIMGFPEEKYRRMAREAGLADIVTFTGRVDYTRAPFFLSAGDIALSPKVSLSEANGKLFNYMACGLPVLAFETPVNREILGDTGIYARYGDAADFAAKLSELALDRRRRKELATRVREKAERDHSWHTRGSQLAEVYRIVSCRPQGTNRFRRVPWRNTHEPCRLSSEKENSV